MAAEWSAPAHQIAAGEIRYHRHQLWLSGQPGCIFVANLVTCSIASNDEGVSEG